MEKFSSRKKLAVMVLTVMLISLWPCSLQAAEHIKGVDQIVTFTIGQQSYQKGNSSVMTDVAPYIKDGRTMVPVAYVAPALGTEQAIWVPESRTVRITKGDDLVIIQIGSKELVANDKVIMMDTAAEIKDIAGGGGRTMLPISFIAKALNVSYQWNGDTRSVDFYGYNETFATKGTYGPDQGTETVVGNVTIAAGDVRLQNKVIKGNLIIAKSVGNGDVYLDNITVEGNTFVRGGGKNSIHIDGGSFQGNVVIENTPEGGTRVVVTNAQGLNIVVATAEAGEEVILEGTFSNVEITATNAVVSTQGQTTIDNIVVNSTATVTVAEGTTVENVTLNSAATVTGDGTVNTANINADDVVISTTSQPDITTAEGVAPPATQTPAPSQNTSSSSGDSGGSDTIAVSALSVTGEAKVGVELTATPTPGAATVTYRWTIADAVDGVYANIDGATTNKYTPIAGNAGRFIKAVAIGSGIYSGTVTSAAKGPIATLSNNTAITTKVTHYNVTIDGGSLLPADNPITANTTPITTAVTVGTFLGNLNQPANSQWKVFANANNPLAGVPPVDGVANFNNNAHKADGDFLAANDLLFVLAEDGTTLRGYHLTVADGTVGAHSVVAAANTATPIAGVNNEITLTVKNNTNVTDNSFTGAKTVTVSGYTVAPNSSYGSFNGTALENGSTAVAGINFTNGVATADLQLNNASAQDVVFSVADVANPAAPAVTITPTYAAAQGLAMVTQPGPATRTGGADVLTTQPVVKVVDNFGNTVTAASIQVDATKAGTIDGWTLGGTTSKNASSGIATFSDLAITATSPSGDVSGAKIAFAANLLAGVSSAAFDIVGPVIDFASTEMTDTTVTFTWTAATGATSVKIQQSPAGAGTWTDATTSAVLNAASTTGTVTGLTASTGYDFKLVVTGGAKAGDSNVAANIITMTAQDGAIAEINAARTNGNADAITVARINTATGQTNAIAGNLATYKTAIEGPGPAINTAAAIQLLVNNVNTAVAYNNLVDGSITCVDTSADPVTIARPTDLVDGSGVTFSFSSKNDTNVSTALTNDNAVITRNGGGSTTLSIDILCTTGGQTGQNAASYLVIVPAGTDAVTWSKN